MNYTTFPPGPGPGTANQLDLQEAVAHFNRIVFLFVPNLCNASCQFCYVAPRFTESARFPPAMLRKAAILADALASWGFQEVRLTGGEPLIFANITEAVRRITSAGLGYRLLTNGIKLPVFTDFLLSNPPTQITVSVHDINNQGSVFGVHVDTNAILESIGRLASSIRVECAIVVEQADWPAMDATLARLAGLGVAQVKLILANVPGISARRESFAELVATARAKYQPLFRWLRASDLDHVSCRLTGRGYLSVDLASMRAYACCVQPGEAPELIGDCGSVMRPSAGGAGGPGYDPTVITDLAGAALRVTGFRCSAHYGACPISLRE
jgi:organic radical activating enzyme